MLLRRGVAFGRIATRRVLALRGGFGRAKVEGFYGQAASVRKAHGGFPQATPLHALLGLEAVLRLARRFVRVAHERLCTGLRVAVWLEVEAHLLRSGRGLSGTEQRASG